MRDAEPEVIQESDEDFLTRIQTDVGPDGEGPLKWRIIKALESIDARLAQAVELLSALGAERRATDEELREKRRRAGLASAAARAARKSTKPTHVEPTNSTHVETKSKRAKAPTAGTEIWTAYFSAYQNRWHVAPLRNQRVNAICAQVAARVGVADGVEVVQHYLKRSDALYVNAKHPVELLARDLQKLFTEMRTGKVVTTRTAVRTELNDHNERVAREYLERNPD